MAQRAKLIKTRAILNEDTNGSLEQLRAEIKRLKAEVAAAKSKLAGAEVGRLDCCAHTRVLQPLLACVLILFSCSEACCPVAYNNKVVCV